MSINMSIIKAFANVNNKNIKNIDKTVDLFKNSNASAKFWHSQYPMYSVTYWNIIRLISENKVDKRLALFFSPCSKFLMKMDLPNQKAILDMQFLDLYDKNTGGSQNVNIFDLNNVECEMAFDMENGTVRNVEEQKIAYRSMKQAKRDKVRSLIEECGINKCYDDDGNLQFEKEGVIITQNDVKAMTSYTAYVNKYGDDE